MKTVFLRAYDRQNLGDDLFLHTIIARYPHVQFHLRAGTEYKKIFASLKNLKIRNPNSLPARILHRIRPSLAVRFRHWQECVCDATVYIGGSIFIEYPQWQYAAAGWDYEASTRRYYILGANFGPFRDPDYPLVMGKIFEKMEDVCFRDRFSSDLFPNVPTVRCAPDILFSYPMAKVPVREKQIFVSVIHCAARDDTHSLSAHHQSYVQRMAALLNAYLADGCNLVLASFCKAEGDEEGIAAILEAMGRPNDERIRTLFYDGTNAHALTTAIAQSDYVISTRFHGVVLALAAGRPVLPIVYSDKTTNMLRDLDYHGESFDLRQDAPWDYARSRRNWDNPPAAISDTIRSEAEMHFRQLDRFLRAR